MPKVFRSVQSLVVVILTILLAGSVLGNVHQHGEVKALQRRPPSTPSDDVYVRRAASLWAPQDRVPLARALDDRYARVIYFADEVCVSLEGELGGVGGVPV